MPKLIVGRLFLRIAEDFIRLIDFLEFLFCTRFLLYPDDDFFAILLVCFLDFLFTGTLAQPEDLIIISFLAHHGSPLLLICDQSHFFDFPASP